MAQVNVPQKKSAMQQIGQYLPLAGLAVGGLAGAGVMGAEAAGAVGASGGEGIMASLGGALKGASAGSSLGSTAGQGLQMLGADNQPSAVERRMNGVQMPQLPDQQAAINNARIALMDQPKEVQQQYMPMLTAAALKLRRDQGVA